MLDAAVLARFFAIRTRSESCYNNSVSKVKDIYVCRSCGGVQSRWMGKCPDCGAWDSLDVQRVDKAAHRDPQKGVVQAWATLAEGGDALLGAAAGEISAKPISRIDDATASLGRISTGIGELDRVLGGASGSGGFVPGSAVLIGGSPGIGKSTLLLQAASSLAGRGIRVLYVSSEESAHQIRMRADRLCANGGGVAKEQSADAAGAPLPDELFVLADTNLARIVEQTRRVAPAVLVIDSVQMIYKGDIDAAPGSLTQLRRCCAELVYLAKLSGIVVVLVGHVTKEGNLAGPMLLEHLVDAVLYFEGDRYHAHRIVRGVKNRFGTTLEIGIFEMTGRGLREAPEGSSVAASEGAMDPRPGSVVCPVMTGSRCVIVEVQALTATGFLGSAKRKSSGLDANRLAMLIAVLEQHAGLRLADRDVFASSVGGIKVVEPASDLALLLAIAGAHYKRALAPATAAIGEVGLGGEVRPVAHVEQRMLEAARLGYKRIIIPASSREARPRGARGLEVVPVKSIGAAIEHLG